MALVLKVAAAALALIGAVTLYWGTNPALLSLGNTVMIVGTVIAAAGVVLFGLAAVLGQLAIVADKLDALRVGLPVGTAVNDAIEPPVVLAPPSTPPVPAPAPAEAPAPAVSPVVLDRLEEALMAPPPPPPPAAARAVATPPSRQSFGLPPLAANAPLAAAGVAAGLAATAAAAPAEARTAEKAPEPAIAPPAAEDRGDDKRFADDDKAFAGDDRPWEGDEKAFAPAKPDVDLALALEDMLAEVKAAEADLAPPPPVPGDRPADPMASLERLLLGASAGDARAPAEPEPIAPALHRDEPDDRVAPEPIELEKAFEALRDLDAPRETPPAAPDLATIPDADDFMARLRETISRPVAAPDLAPPVPAEPEPVRPEPAPLSIEEELERALQASFAEAPLVAAAPPVVALPPVVPVPPPAVEPPRRSEPPRLELIRPDPAAAAAAPGDDAMAALARDFPELNDLLAPKAPAVDPATSLMDDLKDIFEPQARAAARQEPVLAAPSPPMPPLLREGVIAGISFRLYGDGSIEADLPEGTTRFASLKDFRAHVGG
jgi:hypothetical protein